jgi:hypothetical protein
MTDRRWRHPYLRLTRIIRTVLQKRLDAATWAVAKAVVRDATHERARVARAAWCN